VGDVTIEVGLGFLADVIGPWIPKSREIFCFLFKKSRRKSATLEPLISLLALVVRKLWPKIDNNQSPRAEFLNLGC